MASTSAVSAVSEQLVRSLLPDETPRSKVRRNIDQFSRTLKHHNFTRTNQFEVQEKLAALEEKFHVLNREDLSDALYKRRSELDRHQDRWIPDVLDLFLHLSHHPLMHSKLEFFETSKEQSAVPVSLKWTDIDSDDPIDRKSRLWRQPKWEDSSSDEDETLPPSIDTSPSKPKDTIAIVPQSSLAAIQTDVNRKLASEFEGHLFWNGKQGAEVSESQVVREVLFMVQGYPTALFGELDTDFDLQVKFRMRSISQESLRSMLATATEIASTTQTIRHWRNPFPAIPFMQVLHDQLGKLLRRFDDNVSNLHATHLLQRSNGGVLSILRTMEDLREASKDLEAAEQYLRECEGRDAITFLGVLYTKACETEQLGSNMTCQMLKSLFAPVFKCYCNPLDEWVQFGLISPSMTEVFLHRVADQTDKARLWQHWYNYTDTGSNRPPNFLLPFIQIIFTIGKTVAFAQALDGRTQASRRDSLSLVVDGIVGVTTLKPFAAAFSASLQQLLSSQLQTATLALQRAIKHRCNLSVTLAGLSTLYLASSPLATDTMDSKLFSQLDRCLSTWNDRFLVCDFLSEIHSTALDVDRVVVHSKLISPSELRTGRRSVDVLANVAFDFLLPWPIANILLPETLASYRRVSLLLIQIRRARYVLQRRAYFCVRVLASARTEASRDFLKLAQGLHAPLLTFTTVLYDHLTSCVVAPLTVQLHTTISSSSTTWTVDDLIYLHKHYLHNLEFSCLTAKKVKIVKDTLVSLLNVCVEFAFLLTDIPLPNLGIETTEFEASLSDFTRKITKMKSQFRKQLDFFNAGLRGVARSSSRTSNTTPDSMVGTKGDLDFGDQSGRDDGVVS